MDTKTKSIQGDDRAPHRNPLFQKLPDQYYSYALQWCNYPRWTIEETANLLTGCVPHRQMFLRGEDHKRLDAEVLENENKIRAALGKELRIVESKKYFEKTYIDASNIIDWARSQSITVPGPLLHAFKETHALLASRGYHTPCMLAIEWVVGKFWEDADLRDPPSRGEIIKALLQQFPELSPTECEMVERVTRHPAAAVNPERPGG